MFIPQTLTEDLLDLSSAVEDHQRKTSQNESVDNKDLINLARNAVIVASYLVRSVPPSIGHGDASEVAERVCVERRMDGCGKCGMPSCARNIDTPGFRPLACQNVRSKVPSSADECDRRLTSRDGPASTQCLSIRYCSIGESIRKLCQGISNGLTWSDLFMSFVSTHPRRRTTPCRVLCAARLGPRDRGHPASFRLASSECSMSLHPLPSLRVPDVLLLLRGAKGKPWT